MKYYKFKTISKDFTTLGLEVPHGVVSYQYTEDLAGVDTEDSAAFLEAQHPECEVIELTYEEVESELQGCRMFQDINKIVQNLIADRYAITDEIKLLKVSTDHPERVAYQQYVDACRRVGTNMKIEKGLKSEQ